MSKEQNEDTSKLRLAIKKPEEWNIYQDKAKRDVVFASYAYLAGEEQNSELQALAERLPKEFEMILSTDFLDDTKAHMYKAAVFINHQTKEVIFANAGTRFTLDAAGAHDIYNDAILAMEKMPPKLESAGIINQMVLDSLGQDSAEYKFHYTGHSLGAALSDMAAADMAIRCKEKGIHLEVGSENKISTMTFENPGAQKVIRKMYQAHGMDPEEYSKDVDYRGVNNKKNLVNQATTHAGKMWEIQPDGQKNDLNGTEVFLQYLSYRLQRIFPLVSRILETLSFGKIGEQFETHRLCHFDNILCSDTGGELRDAKTVKRDNAYLIEVLTKCKKIVFEEGIFSFINNKKQEKGDVGKQEFIMQNPEEEIITSSVTELQNAVSRTASAPSFAERVGTNKAGNKRTLEGSSMPIVPTAAQVLKDQRRLSI